MERDESKPAVDDKARNTIMISLFAGELNYMTIQEQRRNESSESRATNQERPKDKLEFESDKATNQKEMWRRQGEAALLHTERSIELF